MNLDSIENKNKNSDLVTLPDVSNEIHFELRTTLDKVGMSKIEMPIRVQDRDGESFRQTALVDAFVSLDQPEAKGIHMSRLYRATEEALTSHTLSLCLLKSLLKNFQENQKGLSESSYIKVDFELPLKRQALKSELYGWRQYPVYMEALNIKGYYSYIMGLEVTYSSTCPCSAALSRQLVQDQFKKDFLEDESFNKDKAYHWLGQASSIVATPHAQRSKAYLKIQLDNAQFAPAFEEVINGVEAVLGTPVQSAVKREDEQEFAKRNGHNLMFCEDAVRRIKSILERDTRIVDYYAKVEHQESLHPHDAVSVIVKGNANGFKA